MPASVITQAPSNTSVISSGNSASEKTKKSSSSKKDLVIVQDRKRRTESTGDKAAAGNTPYSHSYPASSSTLVSLAGNSGLRLQTPEGLQLVAASTVPYAALQTSKPSASSNDRASFTAVNVPTYMDSNQVYQATTVQLVPVSAGQQIMVWPPVVQPGKTAPQLTVVPGSQLFPVVDTATASTQSQKSGSTGTNASIITID